MVSILLITKVILYILALKYCIFYQDVNGQTTNCYNAFECDSTTVTNSASHIFCNGYTTVVIHPLSQQQEMMLIFTAMVFILVLIHLV